MATPDRPILFSERGGGLSPATVRLWFHRLYTSLKMDGCSSHSGRRTFITRAARRVSQVGGSLRDVQELAGHTSLAMTQRYIEGDTEAKRKLVRAGRCRGLCRYCDLLDLKVHVWIPALEDGAQFPVECPHSSL